MATLSSNFTGIQIDIFSDQDAFQVYSCPGQNGMSLVFSPHRHNVTDMF